MPRSAARVNAGSTMTPVRCVLRRGVGFHHAVLPGDIQAELEDGIRRGPLRYLVATTTLVEGINFPVRSVLIGDRGYQGTDGYVTTLDAPKLMNAVGRAARAGRETEGWTVLSLNKEFSPDDSPPLLPTMRTLWAALTPNSYIIYKNVADALVLGGPIPTMISAFIRRMATVTDGEWRMATTLSAF